MKKMKHIFGGAKSPTLKPRKLKGLQKPSSGHYFTNNEALAC